MSKAILVIDMPNNCKECDYCGWSSSGEDKRACMLLKGWFIDGEDIETKRSVICPLKPIPTKKAINTRDVFANAEAWGWNACLDEIERGTE